nr:hypothetical protein [Tanacetum cinerariifolium]
KQKPKKTRRNDNELPQTSVPTEVVADEAIYEEMYDKQSLDEEDASKQGRNIADINADAKTTLVDETTEDQGRYNDQEMFDIGVLDNEEVIVEKAVAVKEVDTVQDQVSAATTTPAKDLTVDDITLAKALKALITSKPKIIRIVVRDYKEPSKSKTTTTPTSVADSTRPKAKGILKNKSFDEVLKAFDKTMSWINSFVSMDTEVVKDRAKGSEIRAEESSKRAREDLQQESTKKQKVDDDQEATELKRCLEIVHDDKDDVTIDVEPLSSKSPTIIDYKIYKQRRKSYFQIIRADGSSQMYYTFSKMLKNFNKEDLEVL